MLRKINQISNGVKNEKLIEKVVQKYSLALLLLFGSRASDKAYQGSDFDIAYASKRELDLMEEAQLIVDLAPLFKSENIDLVNLKKASPLLLYAITKNCQVLYERKALTFVQLRAYAFKQYVETKPLYEAKFKRLQETIKTL